MAKSPDDDWLNLDDDFTPKAGASTSAESKTSDIDRSFDRKDFLRLRLKIFKDEYRETAHESEEAFARRGFDDAFKRCIGFCRQLGRAKGTLKAFKPKDDQSATTIHQLLEKVDSCLDRIRNVQVLVAGHGQAKLSGLGDAGEFDMDFASRALPQYDAEDMELFLGEKRGDESDERRKGASDKISAQVNSSHFENALNDLEKESGQILALVCDVLHSRGICDGFIYA